MRYVREVKPLPVYIGTLDVIRQPAKVIRVVVRKKVDHLAGR